MIDIITSFNRTSKALPFTDTVMTKAEMLAGDDTKFTDGFPTVCKETKEFYIYQENATPSAETGKFVLVETGGGGDLSNYYTKLETNLLLDDKANATDVYTKTETDGLLADKVDSTDVYTKNEVYTKTETDTLLDAKANSTDVYTKTETDTVVDTKIAEELANFDKLDYQIVDTLPTTGEAGVRYLIKIAGENKYNEYIYVNDEWHNIGTTDTVDLSTYYDKTEVDALLDEKANANEVYTTTETDGLLDTKANVTDVYTKTETDTLLADKANSADVYTKTEVNTELAKKGDADFSMSEGYYDLNDVNGTTRITFKENTDDFEITFSPTGSGGNTKTIPTKDYVDTEVAKKQDTLVSGTNIKTVNNASLLGDGNLEVGGFPKITLTNGMYSDGMGITYVRGEVDGITTEEDLVGKIFEMTIPNTKMIDWGDEERPLEYNTQRLITLVSGGVTIGEYSISDMNGQTISPDWEHDTTVITQFITKTVTSGAESKNFGVLNLHNKGEIENYSFNYASTFDVSEIGDTITVATVQTFLRNYYGINDFTTTSSTGRSTRRGPQLYVANLSAFTEPDSTIFKRQTATFDMIITCSDGSYIKQRKTLIKNNNYFINQGVVPVDGAYIDTGLYLKGNVQTYGFEGFTQTGTAAVIIGAFESQTARFTVRILGASNKLQIMVPQNNEITSTEADMDFTKRFTCTINYNNGTPKVILLQDGKRFEKDLTGRNDTQSSRTTKFLIGNETATGTYGNGVIYSARVNFRDIGAINVKPFMYEGEVVFADNEVSPSVNTIKRAVQGHFEVYNPNATV